MLFLYYFVCKQNIQLLVNSHIVWIMFCNKTYKARKSEVLETAEEVACAKIR